MNLAATLEGVERSATSHLRLRLIGVVLDAAALVDLPSDQLAAHPFFAAYLNEALRLGHGQAPSSGEWRNAVAAWASGHGDLPLERLKAAGLGETALDLLVAAAFCEHDGELARLFGEEESLSARSLGALCGADELQVANQLSRLVDLGLVRPIGREGPRHSWRFGVLPELWDALAGLVHPPAGLVLEGVETLPSEEEFVPPGEAFPGVERIAAILRGAQSFLCIRGPARNGRHMLAACTAKALGLPLLTLQPGSLRNAELLPVAGLIACVTGAVIACEALLAPGEEIEVPDFPIGDPALIVLTGRFGGLRSPSGKPAVTIDLPAPARRARAALWRRSHDMPAQLADELALRFRLTSGNLVSTARRAALAASMAGDAAIAPRDVQLAARALHDARLETIAQRIEGQEGRGLLTLEDEAMSELSALVARCRHREALSEDSRIGNAGVRALFAGPSGTGKTLSARWLASELGKDVYRLDLAACVNKYIGETEKALDRAFSAAEDLDCILLIDEGDALMTRRTEVSGANDRYANLETNFLLQRIESFEGILVVTTNAPERIDKAFARRMDVVVQFRAPDEAARFSILSAHLGEHQVSSAFLDEVACRCALTGGQLRNVALHARLLSFEGRGPPGDGELRAALVREYRKSEAHCPLKVRLAEAG